MRSKVIRYSEGLWFAVPLARGTYTLGLLARGGHRNKGGLGYFFKTRYPHIPGVDAVEKITVNDTVMVAWFSDLGLVQETWLPIVQTSGLRHEDWPIPRFGRQNPLDKSSGWLVEYEQDTANFGRPARETRVPVEIIVGLPQDGLWGSVAIERELERLIPAE